MRKALALLVAAGLVFGVVATAAAAPKPAVMFTDDSGDADVGQGLGGSIPGGWDLTEGTIVKNGANLEFTVTHADMPPSGTVGEATRFLWAFAVNGKNYRLTVKSFDIGKPDVLQQQTTERVGRADVNGHFRLEGECFRDATLPVNMINCPPLAYLEGSFDPATKSFTVIVPMKSVKAKPGSVVAPGGGENVAICSICWVSHYAERSLNNTLIDTAAQTVSYKIPK
ncbi:MAG TPA: hypothetical protein VG929_03865 [Actinomycetota bacterium]|nr:hypothetical protein [Actinomycetota bacterium]